MTDPRAWVDRLYREHGHAVFRRARRLLGDAEDARDVVHDVFLDLYRDGDRFAGRSSVATYLYSMATHASLNRLRNGQTRTRLVAIEASARSGVAPPAGALRTLAHQVLARLTDEDAALAVYLYCDELTHAEIASLVGCTARQVGDRARRLGELIEERVA